MSVAAHASTVLAGLAVLASCSEPQDGSRGQQSSLSQQDRPLIAFSPVQTAVSPPREKAQSQALFVAGDLGALARATASKRRFAVSLFGRSFELEPAQGRRSLPRNVWQGRINDSPEQLGGRALIIVDDAYVYLKLYTPTREYAVLSQGGEVLLARETDVESLPDESEPERDEPSELRGKSIVAQAQVSQQTIEVLLLYDKALKAKLDKMPNGIMNFVTDRQARLDDVYLNGANNLNVNVVIKAHELYDGKTSPLPKTQSKSLRDWPKFGSLREKHGADLVALVVDDLDGSCGIAPMGGIRSTTDHKCEGKWTVAHEIGHNLDAQHSRGGSDTDAQQCNYGYRVPGIARTVMAYACQGKACPRQPYFSDVRLKHGTTTMGKACGASDGAQNVLTVRRNIPIAAAYRPKVP